MAFSTYNFTHKKWFKNMILSWIFIYSVFHNNYVRSYIWNLAIFSWIFSYMRVYVWTISHIFHYIFYIWETICVKSVTFGPSHKIQTDTPFAEVGHFWVGNPLTSRQNEAWTAGNAIMSTNTVTTSDSCHVLAYISTLKHYFSMGPKGGYSQKPGLNP